MASITLLVGLLPVLLSLDGFQCTKLKAAVETHYNLRVRPIEKRDPQQIIPLQRIEIEANQLPLLIHFKSRSSKLQLSQSHDANKAEMKRSNSEEEPDILMHEVKKPIFHQVKEVIMPFRKTIQEIRPVREELKTVISKETNDEEEHGINGAHHEDETTTELNQYYVPGQSRIPPDNLATIVKSENGAHPEGDMYTTPVDESLGHHEEGSHHRTEEPEMENDIYADNSLETREIDKAQSKGKKTAQSRVNTNRYYPSQPTFERRSNSTRQYPLMHELQRMATGYMLAQYAAQLKQYKSNKLANKKHPMLKYEPNQLDDMVFGDSRTRPKYTKHKWSLASRRNSATSTEPYTSQFTGTDYMNAYLPFDLARIPKTRKHAKYRKVRLPARVRGHQRSKATDRHSRSHKSSHHKKMPNRTVDLVMHGK